MIARTPPPARGASRRESKRAAERRRRHTRNLALVAIAVAAIVGPAAALVAFAPATPPAPPPGAGPQPPAQPMHIHPHLAIFRGTQEATLPSDIGIAPGRWNYHDLDAYSLDGMGMSPLHTHDSSGDIHVESTVTRDYTLGEFFAVWGQPIGPTHTVDLVPDSGHTLTMSVDGVPSNAWGALVLRDGQHIEVHYDAI